MPYTPGEILSEFGVSEAVRSMTPLGNGHIHSTFRVVLDSARPDLVLQRINHHVFPDVPRMMANIDIVTRRLGRPPQRQLRSALGFLRATDGRLFRKMPDGSFWRACHYITGSRTYEQVPNLRVAEQAGMAYGEFLASMADIPSDEIAATIAHFHSLPFRLRQYEDAL